MRITTGKEGKVRVVRLAGQLDFFTADELRRQLRDFRAAGDLFLLVDLSEVAYVDSSGLGLLIEMQHCFTSAAGRMKLSGVNPEIRRVLDKTDLFRFFEVHETEAAALAGFP